MPDKVRIALDAMGGDHGASVVLPGARHFAHPPSRHRIHAVRRPRRARADARRAARGSRPSRAVVHTEIAIRMDDKPSQALRYGRWKSSMWLAIDAVKKGEADVAVSAGNTGALMAMARFNLKMIEGIERPAHRGAVADAQGRVDRARRRRLDRRRRSASGQSRRHGQRHGARAVRHRAADRRPAQYRRRGGQGARTGARGRPHPARRQFPAFRLSRLRRGRRHRQGHGRRRGHRRLCRQYRAEDRRGHRPAARRNICAPP